MSSQVYSLDLELIEAAEKGNIDIVSCLLKGSGVDKNFQDKDGKTAFHIAAYNGHLEVVNALLDAGVNVNLSNIHGLTALHRAASGGHLEVVNALLQAGADVNSQECAVQWTPLHWAACRCNVELVEALLRAPGVNVDLQDSKGWTALHEAVMYGHFDVVNALLQAGADVNLQGWDGRTALDMTGPSENIKALLKQHSAIHGPGGSLFGRVADYLTGRITAADTAKSVERASTPILPTASTDS